MNPKTLCDQNTKEQLAEKLSNCRHSLVLKQGISDIYLKKIEKLESENAELKKYLKHARDDKKIRLGEIRKMEEARESDAEIVSAHMNERRYFVRKIRKLEAVVEAAKVYKEIRRKAGSRSSIRARMELWDALADLEKVDETTNENPQT